jgi:hypothetical protein
MKQITLNIKDSKFKFFLKLIKNFDFVQVEEDEGDSKEAILFFLKSISVFCVPQTMKKAMLLLSVIKQWAIHLLPKVFIFFSLFRCLSLKILPENLNH